MVRCWVLAIETSYLTKNEVARYGVTKNAALNLILTTEVIMKRWMLASFTLLWSFVSLAETDLSEFAKKYFSLWTATQSPNAIQNDLALRPSLATPFGGL